MNEEISTKELIYLLNNCWCVKETDPQTYFNIKNNLDKYKDFIRDKLGSRLIVNDRFIKLEKIPAIPKSYMGIPGFKDKLEYILLFIVLTFLEDKPKFEQFILSNLIDYITNTATTLELDNIPNWNILHHRKCLANVMNHLEELNIIKIVEETGTFTEDSHAEGLYEATGISNYYIREFKNNIQEYTSLSDYIQDEFSSQDVDSGVVRRYHVYRHLVYSLVAYKEDLTEFEIDYLRRFRGNINIELSKYLGLDLELTKNMAITLFDDDTREKDYFPNSKAISDIVLLVNKNILDKVDKGQLSLENNETILITKEEFERIIKETRLENLSYFSKFYKTLPVASFIKEVIDYMSEYDFIRIYDNGFKICPAVSKFTGYIPKESDGQLDLFQDESGEEYE